VARPLFPERKPLRLDVPEKLLLILELVYHLQPTAIKDVLLLRVHHDLEQRDEAVYVIGDLRTGLSDAVVIGRAAGVVWRRKL